MRVAVFFIYLGLILLKMGDHANAIAPLQAVSYTPAQYTQPSEAVEFIAAGYGNTISNNSSTGDPNYFLFIDDVDDEDSNDSIARSFKLLARCYSILSFQPDLGYPVNRSKAAPSFCGRVSHKYIVQRVLRV
jgi:hypothetical protein